MRRTGAAGHFLALVLSPAAPAGANEPAPDAGALTAELAGQARQLADRLESQLTHRGSALTVSTDRRLPNATAHGARSADGLQARQRAADDLKVVRRLDTVRVQLDAVSATVSSALARCRRPQHDRR